MAEPPNLDPTAAEAREQARQDGHIDEPPAGARISKAEVARRNDQRAAELRVAGYSYAQIARVLGYRDHSGAYKAAARARRSAIREAGSELIALELERYDTLQRAAMTKAVQGDARSITAALRVMAQRQRLLGLHEQRDEGRIADAREAFAAFLGELQTRYPDPEPEHVDEGAA